MQKLRDIAYFQCGGTVDHLFEPTTIAEVQAAMRQIKVLGKPYFFLGAGTNSLVLDEHFPGAVIALHKLNKLTIEGEKIICEAGVDNTKFSLFALEKALKGAEWMYRLPGQLGATARMNARCYGGEISQIVSKVFCVDLTGELITYESIGKNIFRGYKDTIFMDRPDLIIVALEINLTPTNDTAALKTFMDKIEADRVQKLQFKFPSCGCVFKNNHNKEVFVPSGILLELAGAKNFAVGLAEINPMHANFVANKGATSSEILELTLKMRKAVYEKFGVLLEYEMEILGIKDHVYAANLLQSYPVRINREEIAKAQELFRMRQTSPK